MRKSTLAISVVLTGLLLALAACGGDLDSGAGDDAGRPAAGGGGGADGDVAEQPGDSVSSDPGSAGGQGLPGVVDRKIVRTANLEVTVEDVAEGMADVERIASNAGGFVSESQLITDNADDDSERRQ